MIKRSTSGSHVKVSFVLPVEMVDQPVSVVGDFNGWDPLAHPLKKRSNGTRSVSVELEPGCTYRFKYLLDDGTWLDDPDAQTADNGHGGIDSIVAV